MLIFCWQQAPLLSPRTPSEDSESWFSQGFYMIPRQHTQSPFGCGAGMLLQMIRKYGETLWFQAIINSISGIMQNVAWERYTIYRWLRMSRLNEILLVQLIVDLEITFQIKVPTWPTSLPWHCYMLLLTPCVSISVPRRPNRISAGESLDIWNDSISPNRSARDQDPAPLTLRPCWRSWFFKHVEDFDGFWFCQSSIDRQWPRNDSEVALSLDAWQAALLPWQQSGKSGTVVV